MGYLNPINTSGERQGFVSPATSPSDLGRWYAYRLEDGRWSYAGVFDTRAEAASAAGVEE